ncbi:MAG: hypothetical protein ILP18_06725 [Treponema sp.]|nr:hypothetical protein [Treponema sp.]
MTMKKNAVLLGMLLAAGFAAFAESVPGVFLQEGGWLWTEQKDGIMSASVKMSEGTAITVETSGETDASGNPVAKIKEAEYDGSKGKTLTFAQVKYDGKSYWAISNRFIMQKKPAVLLEDCAMYNTKSLADVVNAHLDAGSVVATGSTVTATGDIDITEVSYFSERQYAVRTVYVKSSKISSSLDDITAFKILGNIAKTSDLDKKQALFESAEALNLSPKVRAAVQKAWDDTFTPDEAAEPAATEEAAGSDAPAGPDAPNGL